MGEKDMGPKEAANAAFRAVADFFAQQGIQDVLLEEIEKSHDGLRWLVTISFTRPSNLDAFKLVVGGESKRFYKVVEIDAATGEMLSIKIRDI